MRLSPPIVIDDSAFSSAMARLGPFEPNAAIAVALSGGRDSTLLCHLAKRWADARQGSVLALIVDHGLRPGSAEEASAVARQCSSNAIEAEILTWSGPKPTTAIQQKARQARYARLEAACRRHGILHLLLGHHADDQAETIAMRTERQSGVVGRAGMAPIVERPDVRLLRPLLTFARHRIDATVAASKLDHIDDPSNRDGRFWRGRYRTSANQHKCLSSAAASRDALLGRLNRWASKHVRWHPLGPALIDRHSLGDLDLDDCANLLGRVVRAVSGADYPPRRDRLTRLAKTLIAGNTRTIAGTVVVPTTEDLMITRDPHAIEDTIDIAPGAAERWDGRFLIGNHGEVIITVRPPMIWPKDIARPKIALPRPATVLASLPALVAGKNMIAMGPFGADGCQCDILVHAGTSAPFSEAPFVV